MSETNICKKCGESYNLRVTCDSTGFCDLCAQDMVAEMLARPKIVCLCGSTRFFQHFMDANYRETMAGNIVLSVGFYSHATEQAHGQNIGITAEDKVRLDELHKRKIDLADEVLVINVGGYIGESTRSEIDYANNRGRSVRYLEETNT